MVQYQFGISGVDQLCLESDSDPIDLEIRDPETLILEAVTNQLSRLFQDLEEKLVSRVTKNVIASSRNSDITNQTSSRNSDINQSPALRFPPLIKIVDLTYPSFNGEQDQFDQWKNHFLAIIAASELSPLIQDDGLIYYNQVVENDTLKLYDVRIYSRIISSLPTNSSFICSFYYRGKGIALWKALLQDNFSYEYTTRILLPAFYTLCRSTEESVDGYFNRFQTHRLKLKRDPTVSLTDTHIREQFLSMLGPEFEFLASGIQNRSLDKKWLDFSEEKLKQELRQILRNKATPSTIGSCGYAHSMKTKPSDNSEAIRLMFEEQNKMLVKAIASQTEALTKAIASKPRPERPEKYSWTHGINHSHTSKECKKPAPGHQQHATKDNKMGGKE